MIRNYEVESFRRQSGAGCDFIPKIIVEKFPKTIVVTFTFLFSGSIMFHVRRRPADYVPRKRKKKPSGKWNELEAGGPGSHHGGITGGGLGGHLSSGDERLPFLQELNPDGTEIANGAGVRHRLQPNVTEVGSERPLGPQAVQAQTLTLTGPTVMPRHCVIAFTENIVTLTPCSRDAHTYVNNQRIHQTAILQV